MENRHQKQKSKISFLVQRATKKNSSPFGGLFFFIIVIENDPGQDFCLSFCHKTSFIISIFMV